MADFSYSTDLVDPKRQLSYWNDAICKTFTSLTCELQSARESKLKGFNASVESVDCGTYQLSKVACDASFVHRTRESVSNMKNEVMLLHLQTSGSTVNSQGNNRSKLNPGDFTLCLNNSPYSVEMDDFQKMLVLRIPLANLDGRIPMDSIETGVKFSYEDSFNRILVNHLRSIWEYNCKPWSYTESLALSESTFSLLSAAITRNNQAKLSLSSDYARLSAVKQYIVNNIQNNRLNTTTIAETCNLSRRKLSQLFKLESTTCSRFLRETRIKTVASLLADPRFSSATVTTIAFEYGFNSIEHFSRSFHSYFGVTPSEYRMLSESGKIHSYN